MAHRTFFAVGLFSDHITQKSKIVLHSNMPGRVVLSQTFICINFLFEATVTCEIF